MPFKTASISSQGGREANEDSTGYLENGDTGCWVVADGLGFHGGGATASRLAVEAVLASFRANSSITNEALETHLRKAHAAIRAGQSAPELSQMKSTVVVLLANQRVALCGYIGDSRLYHLQGTRVAYQTQDHSVPGALAASGSIAYREIRFHEDRNRLLRSLGGDNESNPTIEKRNLCQGDAFLLCSDGFWEYVNEMEMEVDFAKSASPAEWLSFMGARLLKRAKADHDNYTGMAVFFNSPSAPAPPLLKLKPPSASTTSRTKKLAKGAVVLLTLTLVLLSAAAIAERFYPGSVQTVRETIRKMITRSGAVPAGDKSGAVSRGEQQ